LAKRLPTTILSLQHWVAYGVLIGLVTGFGTVAFYYGQQQATSYLVGDLAGYKIPIPSGEGITIAPSLSNARLWLLVLLPAVGGLLSGFLVYTFSLESEGLGTNAVIAAFHKAKGRIRKRVPIVKATAVIATLGFGGSAGREGSAALIGGGVGSWFAELRKLNDVDRRILVVSGIAAGIGSIFRAPLGGAIFAIEVLYLQDFEVEAIIPAFVSSVVSYAVFSLFYGFGPIFITPSYAFTNVLDLIPYAVLGLLLAPVAIVYIKVFYGLRNKIFQRIKIPNQLKPAIGGLALGAMALFIPEILGIGYGWIQLAIYGEIALTTLILIGFFKIVATSLTVGSGASGGVFAPSLVIGGMLGGAVGTIFSTITPSFFPEPGAFIIVGMGAFLAAAAHVPIASIIMVAEMTRNYELLFPAMIACALSYLLVRRWTIYEQQVPVRNDSPAHLGEYNREMLEQVTVAQAANNMVVTVSPKSSVKEIAQLILSTGHMGYPVIDEGKLIGIVSYSDLLKVPVTERGTITIGEIMTTKLHVIYPQDDMYSALYKMELNRVGRLPVVNPDNPTKLVGIVTRSDVIRAHEKIEQEKEIRGRPSFFDKILVKEIMSNDIVTVSANTSISEFEKIASTTGHESYPVVEDEKIVGVATAKGLIRNLSKKNAAKIVADVMDKTYFTIYSDATVAEALIKMYENNVWRLIVVDKTNPNKPTGLITKTDAIMTYVSKRIINS
jgi:CIC family chloride channel protein